MKITQKRSLLFTSTLFIFLLFALSCKVFILKAMGYVRNPKLESHESVMEYCNKKQDPYDILWMPTDFAAFDTIMSRYPGIPSVTIYNASMQQVDNAQGEGCHKMLLAFFNDTVSNSHITHKTNTWGVFEKNCEVVDNRKSREDYNYTVVYSWAIYTPRLTRDIFERMRNLKSSKQYNIRFISLNKDFQKGIHKEVPKFKN